MKEGSIAIGTAWFPREIQRHLLWSPTVVRFLLVYGQENQVKLSLQSRISFAFVTAVHTKENVMSFRICYLVVVLLSFKVVASLHTGDQGQFCLTLSASFITTIDQTIGTVNYLIRDPEYTFFKEIMGFRDDAIQHMSQDDAFKFFNDTYGLDFSLSQPNKENEYFFENAKLSLFRFPRDVHYLLVLNNWIQTGNTRVTCRDIHDGGFEVTFQGGSTRLSIYGFSVLCVFFRSGAPNRYRVRTELSRWQSTGRFVSAIKYGLQSCNCRLYVDGLPSLD